VLLLCVRFLSHLEKVPSIIGLFDQRKMDIAVAVHGRLRTVWVYQWR
jgi:hypothetical protein